MPSQDILNSYTLAELRKFAVDYNKKVREDLIPAIRKMKKPQLITEMLKKKQHFHHIKMKPKNVKKAPLKEEAPKPVKKALVKKQAPKQAKKGPVKKEAPKPVKKEPVKKEAPKPVKKEPVKKEAPKKADNDTVKKDKLKQAKKYPYPFLSKFSKVLTKKEEDIVNKRMILSKKLMRYLKNNNTTMYNDAMEIIRDTKESIPQGSLFTLGTLFNRVPDKIKNKYQKEYDNLTLKNTFEE